MAPSYGPHKRYGWLAAFVVATTTLLVACGGGGGPWTGEGGSAGGGGVQPGVPGGLDANAGDGVVSLGWATPATGTGPFSYKITIAPTTAGASITQNGTTALIENLSNGTTYTFSVTASNTSGQGTSASVQARPASSSTSAYGNVTILGDNSSTGILDASPLRGGSTTTTWMAYSGASFYNLNGQLIQDVAARLARSDDGGQTFTFIRELGTPQPATVTDSLGTVCGGGVCTGRWVYAAPWLVDDSSDPNAARRFKLFAHKYFLYPQAPQPQQFQLGSIVLWTASAPDGAWSSEQSVLGWNFTPPELTATNNVNTLDPALAQCLTASEGTASLHNGVLDFAFTCAFDTLNPLARKIVLLRSPDHAISFQFVSTLLQPSDAALIGAAYFADPALLPSPSNAPVLIATPVTASGQGVVTPAGCHVIPITDEQSGTLLRNAGNAPAAILTLPSPTNTLGGGCAWDRGITGTGIMMNSFVQTSGPFSILKTNRSL